MNKSTERKVMMKEVKKYWIYGVFSLLLTLSIQLVRLIQPKIMQQMLDVYIPTENYLKIYTSILLIAGIPFLTTLVNTFFTYKVWVIVRKFAYEIKTKIFRNVMDQPMSFFKDRKIGELATYCNIDISDFVFFWIHDIPLLICGIITAGVIIFILFSISVKMTIIMIFSLPLATFPSTYMGKKAMSLAQKAIKAEAKSNSLITNTIKSIRLIKSNCFQNEITNKMTALNKKIIKIYGRAVAIDKLCGTWSGEFVGALFTAIGFGVGVLEIINGNITIGQLIAYTAYLPRLFSVCSKISMSNMHIKKTLGKQENNFKFLAMDNEYTNDSTNEPLENINGHIEFKEVGFSYRNASTPVFKDLSFTITPGEFVTIMGESGTGKSTLLDLLLKFYNPSNGKILIDGIDISHYPIDFIRDNISIVSQNVELFDGTLKDNLLISNKNCSQEELEQAIRNSHLEPVVTKLENGLDTDISENGSRLSGGERQRVALAMALLKKSKIILLDEASSNLDITSESLIYKRLHKLSKKYNLTILSVTHRHSYLNDDSRVLILENGHVVKNTFYKNIKSYIFKNNSV